jgi:hypothetical protein
MDMNHCEPPFWRKPSILYHPFRLEYEPKCKHAPWNFFVRVLILSTLVGMVLSSVGGAATFTTILLFGFIIAGIIIWTTPIKHSKKIEHVQKRLQEQERQDQEGPQGYIAPIAEHFINGGSAKGSVQPHDNGPIGLAAVDAHPYAGPSLPDHTPPTSRNPFMNILLDDIKYNPSRPEASPVNHPAVSQTMDDFFRIQWFSDPTDVFGKTQNQRQFITQPSTTVPNDQGSFANWLYKIPGKTCKEGGRAACYEATNGSSVVWMENQ